MCVCVCVCVCDIRINVLLLYSVCNPSSLYCVVCGVFGASLHCPFVQFCLNVTVIVQCVLIQNIALQKLPETMLRKDQTCMQ